MKQVRDEVFLDENSDYDPDVDDSGSIGSDTSSVSVRQGVQQHLPTETSSDTELDQPQPSTSTGRGHGPPGRYSDFVFFINQKAVMMIFINQKAVLMMNRATKRPINHHLCVCVMCV